jgi:hypothetical protein
MFIGEIQADSQVKCKCIYPCMRMCISKVQMYCVCAYLKCKCMYPCMRMCISKVQMYVSMYCVCAYICVGPAGFDARNGGMYKFTV